MMWRDPVGLVVCVGAQTTSSPCNSGQSPSLIAMKAMRRPRTHASAVMLTGLRRLAPLGRRKEDRGAHRRRTARDRQWEGVGSGGLGESLR